VVAVADRPADIASLDPAPSGWIERMRASLAFGVLDKDATVVALAGFLLRGGIVLLALPGVVLPSVIGIAGASGLNAFAIDGHPTPWFVEVAIVIGATLAIWLLLAFLVGSVVDVWLIEARLSGRRHASGEPRPIPESRFLIDMTGIRVICLVPLAAALAWAYSQIYDATYNELTTPSNLATPLVLRILESASGAVFVVSLVWLLSEVVGAIAVRRLVLFDTGIARSLADALVQLVRQPASSAATVVLSFGTSIIATVIALAATAAAFDWCRVIARTENPIVVWIGLGSFGTARDVRVIVFVIAAITLGLVWMASLTVAGMASAWRSAALTGETAATLREDETGRLKTRLGLSDEAPETSGD
jgi:hypothetical protein